MLRRSGGPVCLLVNGITRRVADCSVSLAERATKIRVADVELLTVEHLFAALGALGVYEGLEIEVEGVELPLLDGGSKAYADAIVSLGCAPSATPLRVTRDGVVDVEGSRYTFSVGEQRTVRVDIRFGDARLAPTAEWPGESKDFIERIASARTFAPEADVARLMDAGLASHVTKESVVVIGKAQILSAGAPFLADEPARHKLLDLMGDLYLYGGPPVGRVHAEKPGHSRTHQAMRRALGEGIVAKVT